jgi:hypothetical protein
MGDESDGLRAAASDAARRGADEVDFGFPD